MRNIRYKRFIYSIQKELVNEITKEEFRIVCSHCGYEQTIGTFCGICGIKLEEPYLESEDKPTKEKATVPHVEPNIHIENIKKKFNIYKAYFVQQLKKPSLAFQQGEKDYYNGLLSIILFAALYSISLFLLIDNNYRGESLHFFPFFIQIMLLTFVLFGIAILSLVVINTFFDAPYSFKAIISFYGGQLSPLLVSTALSFVLMVIKSFTYGNIILVSSFIFALFILPLYLVSFLVSKKPTGIDPLYGFILYIVVFILLFVILVTILAGSSLGRYFDNMIYLF